jgi:hypothetical protein
VNGCADEEHRSCRFAAECLEALAALRHGPDRQ